MDLERERVRRASIVTYQEYTVQRYGNVLGQFQSLLSFISLFDWRIWTLYFISSESLRKADGLDNVKAKCQGKWSFRNAERGNLVYI